MMAAGPMSVIALEYEHPAVAAAARPSRMARVSVIAAWSVCAIAWVLIMAVDVETVIVTGPIIATLGLMILIRGIIERRAPFTVLGASHLGICLLFVVLVNLFRWSPAEATKPFVAMGTVYLIANGVVTLWLLSPSRWRQVARI
jgi:hypothetical protein